MAYIFLLILFIAKYTFPKEPLPIVFGTPLDINSVKFSGAKIGSYTI